MTAAFGVPEYLSLPFFSFFSILAWWRRLHWVNRMNATLLGVSAIGLLMLPAVSAAARSATFGQVLPLLLMPMAYWQTGQFKAPLNEKLQRALADMDRKTLAAFQGFPVPSWLEKPIRAYLEFAYLLVYPMVPSALAVLYFAGAIEHASDFWSVVLPPAYACYATLPFLRTLPPRVLERTPRRETTPAGIRGFNLIVVRVITHQANTFPSGHA